MNPMLIINQIFEMQAKISETDSAHHFERNFSRLYNLFQEEGYIIQNPTGESYSETRTDCEASISGHADGKMKIIRTIKPIVYQHKNGDTILLQKAVVIVGNK